MRYIAAFLFIATVSAAALAETVDPKTCMDTAGTNYEFAMCSASIQKAQDKKLEDVWACVLSKQVDKKSPAYLALVAEQDAWLAFKEKACQLYTSQQDFGREGAVLHYGGCKSNLIRQRIEYLDHVLYPSTDDTCMGSD